MRVPGRKCLFLLLAAVFAATGISAQKRVSKTLLEPHISSIVIDGQQCFEIRVQTADTDHVVVEAEMEGEYQGDVLVQTETLGRTLRVSTAFSPVFELPNDKLGAHKILSIRLQVTLPEYQNVRINGRQAEVFTSGQYRKMTIRIQDGRCELRHLAEDTRVNTDSADISAWIQEGTVDASSRHGNVDIAPIPYGDGHTTLRSRDGDIRVSRNP